MVDTAFGFKPIRNHSGQGSFPTRLYPKDTSGDDESLIYPGDPVYLTAAGKVLRLPADASAKAAAFLGVVQGFAADANGRPKTHSLPTQAPYSATADADYVYVYDRPDMIYETVAGVSASMSLTGQTVDVSAGARSTAVARSGYTINTTGSASSKFPFRVVGISRRNLGSDGAAGDSNGLVEVMPNTHAFSSNGYRSV